MQKAAELVIAGGQGGLEEGARLSEQNNFQGRYAIRHAWTGPMQCAHPTRKIWGSRAEVKALLNPGFIDADFAADLAFAPRGEIELAQVVRQDIPELGIIAGAKAANPLAGGLAAGALGGE